MGTKFINFFVLDAQGQTSLIQTYIEITDELDLCGEGSGLASNLTALCQHGLSASFGLIGGVPTATIPATAFDAGSYSDNVSAALTFSVKAGFSAPRQASLVVNDCNSMGGSNVTVYVSDGQGNEASCESFVNVGDPSCLCYDCGGTASATQPRAIARNGVAAQIHTASSTTCPEALCRDRAWVEVPATAFNQGSFDGQTASSALILKIGDSPGAVPSDLMRFDCSHLGQRPVTLFVTDADGESSVAETWINIEDTMGVCSQVGCGGN